MVPYKRMDLIVDAFSQMPDKKLVVIGDGPEMKKIKEKATSNIEILGYQSDTIMKEHMQKAKAFVFAAEEDFGITPVEAQACGTPVIAFGKGGALETVIEFGKNNPTGLFFNKQSTLEIMNAVNKFEAISDKISPLDCCNNAKRFSIEVFQSNIEQYISNKWADFKDNKSLKL